MEYPRQTNNLIATLRGLPEDHSVAKLRPAYELGNLIEVLEQKYKIGQTKIEDLIAQNWKQIVGEQAAHRSNPQKVIGGAILLVQLSNPVLLQELRFKQNDILAHIHRLPGGGIIKAVNFRLG
jgi:hypothetical protein